jgi:hypothetical protein
MEHTMRKSGEAMAALRRSIGGDVARYIDLPTCHSSQVLFRERLKRTAEKGVRPLLIFKREVKKGSVIKDKC